MSGDHIIWLNSDVNQVCNLKNHTFRPNGFWRKNPQKYIVSRHKLFFLLVLLFLTGLQPRPSEGSIDECGVYVLLTASTYLPARLLIFLAFCFCRKTFSLPRCYSLILISIILTGFYTVDTNNIFSLSRALLSNVLIFPGQNDFTITFGRPWACREIIWLLLSKGISRVKRLLFYVGRKKGLSVRDGHQLNGCYLQQRELLC